MSSEPKFEGSIQELKGHVYECYSPYRHSQADQFKKTTEKIADYFLFHCTDAACMHRAILQQELPEEIPPAEPRVVVVQAEESDVGKSDGNRSSSEVNEEVSNRNHNEYELVKFEIAYKSWLKQVHHMKQLNMTLYSVVMSQCSPTMRIQIQTANDYTDFHRRRDGIALLRSIKDICYNNNNKYIYKMDAMNQALIQLLTCRQTPSMSVMEYYHRFQTRRDVYEYLGGSTTASPGTLTYVAQSLNVTNNNNMDDVEWTSEQMMAARERELAALFMQNADRKRNGHLQNSLKKDFVMGHDTNPKTVLDAYRLMVNWKDPMVR